MSETKRSDRPSFEAWCAEIARIIFAAVGARNYTAGMEPFLRPAFDRGVAAAEAAIDEMRPPSDVRR